MEISEQAIKNNIVNLEYAAKELEKLAKKIKNHKNRRTTEEEKNQFAALIVESSFFMNCFGAASGAFGKAFQDVSSGTLKGSPLLYLRDELELIYKDSLKGEKSADTN